MESISGRYHNDQNQLYKIFMMITVPGKTNDEFLCPAILIMSVRIEVANGIGYFVSGKRAWRGGFDLAGDYFREGFTSRAELVPLSGLLFNESRKLIQASNVKLDRLGFARRYLWLGIHTL
jgi:hypothetical protein